MLLHSKALKQTTNKWSIFQTGCFIQPLEEKLPGLSYVQQRDTDSGSVRQVAVADTFQRIPLTPLLNRLLSLPGVLKANREKVMV